MTKLTLALTLCAFIAACGNSEEADKKALERSLKKALTKALNKGAATAVTSSAPTGPLKAAPRVSWTGYSKNKMMIDGLPGSELFFYMSTFGKKKPLTLAVSTRKLPDGTRIKIGAQSFTVERYQRAFDVDLSDKAAALPLAAIYHRRSYKIQRVDPKLPLEVSLPGHKPIVSTVPTLDFSRSVALFLREVADGKVTFQGESSYDGKIDTIATAPRYAAPFVAGKGKHVSDIDLVVVSERGDVAKTKTCRFKKGPATISFFSEKVTLYNRHTGKKLAEDTITPGGRCPMFAMLRNRAGEKGVDSEKIHAWARKALKRYRM